MPILVIRSWTRSLKSKKISIKKNVEDKFVDEKLNLQQNSKSSNRDKTKKNQIGKTLKDSNYNKTKKNPAYGRQSISRPMRIVAPIPQ